MSPKDWVIGKHSLVPGIIELVLDVVELLILLHEGIALCQLIELVQHFLDKLKMRGVRPRNSAPEQTHWSNAGVIRNHNSADTMGCFDVWRTPSERYLNC